MHTFYTLPHDKHHQLQDESCRLLKFQTVNLKPNEHQILHTEDHEMLIVALSGTAHITINQRLFENVGGRSSVFNGLPHSVYVPRNSEIHIQAITAFQGALPSAPSDLDTDPYEIKPEQVNTGTWGALNYKRQYREILVQPNGMPASRLIVGETLTPSGNWSTYPPHKHEEENGSEKFHEEMYYFRISSPEGWGVTRHYSPEHGFDHTHIVRDHSLLAIPRGYHTYASAPGYQSYYLWFLAGEGRTQGVKLDPEVGWVQRTVGMV